MWLLHNKANTWSIPPILSVLKIVFTLKTFSIVRLIKLFSFWYDMLVYCVFLKLWNVLVSLLLCVFVCCWLSHLWRVCRWSWSFVVFSLWLMCTVLCCITCCWSFPWCTWRFWFWFVLVILIFWEVFLRFCYMVWFCLSFIL